jgi:DUF4097 and DUF4098 domain-containing protein YvlB
MQKTFTTPHPVSLFVELRSGDLTVVTAETDETVVDVTVPHGDDDDVSVEQRGDDISVVARHGGRGGLFGASRDQVHVRVTVPHDSRLLTKLGSADVRVEGRLGETTLKSGSGDITLDELGAKTFVETGSGDLQIGSATGPLQVKCGSGQVTVERLGGPAQISTGSGDVLVGTALEAISVKSGSGDLRVREASGDVALNTASGDLVVDRMLGGALSARNASGDIVVGVPAGVPVWTDISTLTGSVRSSLVGAGAPAEGQEYVELRAKTVSGDISLEQL